MGPRRVRRAGRPHIPTQPVAQPVREASSPKRFLWLRRTLLVLLGAALLVGFLFGLKITKVNIVPAEYAGLLQPQAEKLIAQHPLWRNLVLLPSGELSAQLEEANQTVIGKVIVHKSFLSRSLLLEIGDRQPVLRWQTGGKTYTLDQKGVVIKEVGGSEQQLPLVVDASNLPADINKVAASNQFVQFMQEAWRQLPAQTGLQPMGARVADTTNEVQVNTGGGFYIRFDTTRPVGEQLEEVKRVLEKDKPTQYLDVRLPYKAYLR